MPDSHTMKTAIQAVIIEMMDRVMTRVMIEDPFLLEKHRADRPLYAALVPDEIFKGSHFERRFITPFGGVWERLALVVAQVGTLRAVRGYRLEGLIKTERLRRISEVLGRLEHTSAGQARVRPDWQAETAYILAGDGDDLPVTVISDVYCEDQQNGRRYSFELKSPLPNSDITKVSKEKLLKLVAMSPQLVDEVFFALPYNPYGMRENYAWGFPGRWFDMRRDPVILIGDEFWDKIGGTGSYRALVEAVNEIGVTYKTRIYHEFLGIDPPDDGFSGLR